MPPAALKRRYTDRNIILHIDMTADDHAIAADVGSLGSSFSRPIDLCKDEEFVTGIAGLQERILCDTDADSHDSDSEWEEFLVANQRRKCCSKVSGLLGSPDKSVSDQNDWLRKSSEEPDASDDDSNSDDNEDDDDDDDDEFNKTDDQLRNTGLASKHDEEAFYCFIEDDDGDLEMEETETCFTDMSTGFTYRKTGSVSPGEGEIARRIS